MVTLLQLEPNDSISPSLDMGLVAELTNISLVWHPSSQEFLQKKQNQNLQVGAMFYMQ